MSWLSDTWDSAVNTAGDVASGIGQAASYTVTYAGAGIAVAGGLVIDAVDNTVVAGAGAILGKDWDLYEGSATLDAGKFIVDGRANELADYIHADPLHAGHVALEGTQQGLGTVVGVAGAVVGGAGGLLADSFNTTVRAVSFGNLELYEGGYGTMAMAGLGQGFATGRNGFVSATDIVMSDPTITNRNDEIIYGATKGATEVVAMTAAVAVTGGAIAPALPAFLGAGSLTAGSMFTSAFTGKVGLAMTLGGTAYAAQAGVAEQEEAYRQELILLEGGTPEGPVKIVPVPTDEPANLTTQPLSPKPFAFGT